jgi:short-subunit dehydrogenase
MSVFKDKVVWITGASSGIGEALVHAFAKQGARIIISARREEVLRKIAASTGLGERDILVLPFDLNDTSMASGLAASAMNHFGRIDVLVNNGGLSQRSEVLETEEVLERQLMEVNYFAQVSLTKAVLPYMIRQKTGQIVVVSSIAGKFGFFLRSTYSAAKHALHGYFESLRLETEQKGIKVLLVCPGKIKTNVSLNAIAAGGKAHGQMDASHIHAMSAEDCAEKILLGIKKEKEEIFIGGKEILMVYIRRFLPALFAKILRKQSPY